MDITQPGALPNPDTSLEPVEYYNDASGVAFTLDGPMARAYTQALNEVYKKEIGPDGLTLESINLGDGYQLSTAAWKNSNWLRALRTGMTTQAAYHQLGMIYGVGKRQIQHTHFYELVKSVGLMSRDQRMNSAVIIDEQADVAPATETAAVVTEALVHLVKRYCEQGSPRICVYPSLQAFIRSRG